MAYKLPDTPQVDGYKTLCVYIPDAPEYISAFLGSYSFLARWVAWERDDNQGGSTAAELFLRAYNLTIDNWSACGNGALPDEEEMTTLNVNVNCCGGSSTTNLICYDQYGQPVVSPAPYTPDDSYIPPTGGTWPMDSSGPAPQGFDDWEAYDVNACAAANAVYEILVFLVAAAVGVVDLAVQMATAMILLAALFPAKMAEVMASTVLSKMAQSLVELASHSEDAVDWLEAVQAYLNNNQQEIVCVLYTNRHNIPGMKLEIVNRMTAYVVDLLLLDAGDTAVLRNFLSNTVPLDVMMAWYTNAADWTLLTVTPIDCGLCTPGDGFEYLEDFAASVGWYGPVPSAPWNWRTDNGGELYTIGHVADTTKGLARTQMLTEMGQAHLDVESWYISRWELSLRRNTSQAVETDFYVTFHYRDGTSATVQRLGATSDSFAPMVFVNPHPEKPMWDSQSAVVNGVEITFPGVPGSSTWFEYFIGDADLYGSYVLGTYVDYGDLRP